MDLMETGRERQLQPGDVLMVTRKMTDKTTKKPYDWRFFMVVTIHKRWVVRGWIVGARGYYKEKEYSLEFDDDGGKHTVQFVSPSEWPDGIHAFRMGMVLNGLIPDIV